MKKLIMFAAAAALAFAGQAATVDWKVTYAGQGATWAGNGATIMAFAGSDYADIVKLVTVDGSDTLQSDLAARSLGSSTFSNNRGTAATPSVVKTSDAPTSMFFMIFSEGSWDADKAVLWTAATDVSGYQYTPPSTGTSLALTAAILVSGMLFALEAQHIYRGYAEGNVPSAYAEGKRPGVFARIAEIYFTPTFLLVTLVFLMVTATRA